MCFVMILFILTTIKKRGVTPVFEILNLRFLRKNMLKKSLSLKGKNKLSFSFSGFLFLRSSFFLRSCFFLRCSFSFSWCSFFLCCCFFLLCHLMLLVIGLSGGTSLHHHFIKVTNIKGFPYFPKLTAKVNDLLYLKIYFSKRRNLF